MNRVIHILDRMRDQILQLEYSAKKDELSIHDFDRVRDLIREHSDLLSELGSELASTEDRWRREV